MLEEFCCHVHVQQARQGGGGGLTASYKVSEDVMYSLRMTSQTLGNVVQVAKNLCEVTGQDLTLATLEPRSSSTCVTRSTKRTNYFNQR